jgi:hypothetical protein
MTIDNIIIGKFILDSLTTGMYDNPLCIFREYIQNSADAIDKAARDEKRDVKQFELHLTRLPNELSSKMMAAAFPSNPLLKNFSVLGILKNSATTSRIVLEVFVVSDGWAV